MATRLVDPGMTDDEPWTCEADPPDREPTAEELAPEREDVDDLRGVATF